MAKVEKSIVISAPVEEVFAYVQEPENLLSFWPGLMEVKDVAQLPNGGTRFTWVTKMAGMRFQGSSEDIEVVANQRVVNRTTGGIDSTITWTYQPEDGRTKVIYEVDYTVPIPLLGKLAEAVLLKQNENEAQSMLANLKARMEA
jgi:uncharacterized protein YndB with AHSA1/START domain